MVNINVNGSLKFGGRVVAGFHDFCNLIINLFLGMGADLTGKGHSIGYDIGGSAAFDAADVGGGFRVDTAERNTAAAATAIALMPFSGSMPPWAVFPWKVMVRESFPAPEVITGPIFPAPSREKMFLAGSLEQSKVLAPYIPFSSQMVKRR